MRIKILSFNIHKGFGYFNKSYNLDAVRQLLEKQAPDIVFLQEMHGLHPSTELQGPPPLEALADQYWPFYKHGVNSVYSGNFHGNAILSRYPIDQWQNTDISTNRLEKRGLLEAAVTLPNGNFLKLYCTHLNLMPPGQLKQLAKICGRINQAPDSPTLLAGDFNDWAKVSRKKIARDTFLLEAGRQKTYPSIVPVMKLDNIFYGRMKRIETSIVRDFRFCSDHLPIYAVFDV